MDLLLASTRMERGREERRERGDMREKRDE